MARNHWKICNLIQVITGGSTTLNKKHTKKRKPDIPRQAPMINNTNWILPSLWMHRVWASSKCIYTNTHIFAQVSLIVYFAQIWTLLQSKPTHGQHWIQMFQHFVFLVCWCPSTHPKINQQTLAELTDFISVYNSVDWLLRYPKPMLCISFIKCITKMTCFIFLGIVELLFDIFTVW